MQGHLIGQKVMACYSMLEQQHLQNWIKHQVLTKLLSSDCTIWLRHLLRFCALIVICLCRVVWWAVQEGSNCCWTLRHYRRVVSSCRLHDRSVCTQKQRWVVPQRRCIHQLVRQRQVAWSTMLTWIVTVPGHPPKRSIYIIVAPVISIECSILREACILYYIAFVWACLSAMAIWACSCWALVQCVCTTKCTTKVSSI